VCVIQSLGVLAKAGGGAWRGCKLALHMLLSHERVCNDIARRVLLPPLPLAPPREYSKEEGLEVIDQIMTSLVNSLGQHSARLHLRCSGASAGGWESAEHGAEREKEEDEDEEEEEGVNVDDCVSAVAGLASCEALLVHVENDSRLPLLVLRLVSLLTGAAGQHMHAVYFLLYMYIRSVMYIYMYVCVYVYAYVHANIGEHVDAARALHGFIANSPAARDSVEKIMTYLACRMADNACPVDVETKQGTAHAKREDKADLCQA